MGFRNRTQPYRRPLFQPKPEVSSSSTKPNEDFETFRLRLFLLATQEPKAVDVVTGETEIAGVAQQVTLYYTDPAKNSDKVYVVKIVRDPVVNSCFYVEYEYGKRGKTLRSGRRDSYSMSMNEARMKFEALVAEKKKEGYTENVSGKPFSR